MNVYTLEVFWGDTWEVVAVFASEEAATQEGERIVTHSADYVKYVVTKFTVIE